MKKTIFLVYVIIISIFILNGCFAGGSSFHNNKMSETNYQNFDSVMIDTSQIKSYKDLVSTCKPAVVGISSISGRYQSIGTGVCIKSGAYVLTNNHVVDGGSNISLYLSNGDTAKANLVWRDASSDLAILKSSKDIPYLPVAQSGSYQSGDEVVAIGTPLDLAFKHSATKGIISAINRTISVDGENGQTALYNLIQHDASINPGNSGGPLINMNGKVIGINTVKVTDAEGMGFAIPVDTFSPVIEKVSANGGYDTTYLGVFGYDNQLKNIGKVSTGFYVESVAKNSPAERAGIKKGDIITNFGDVEIKTAKDLKSALYNYNVNDVVSMMITTQNQYKFFDVKLVKHPYAYAKTNVKDKSNDTDVEIEFLS